MTTKAVIFDLFGTLIANYDRDRYLGVIENMGETAGVDPVEFRTLWRDYYVDRLTGVHSSESANIRWVCDRMGIETSPEQVKQANQVYLEFAVPFLMAPRESAVHMLYQLKMRGIKTGLLSDCGPWVPAHWNDSPFAGLIDFPIYSCKSGAKKPDADLYRAAADGLEVRAPECMYVADGNGDELLTAGQLGMEAIRITPWNEPGSNPDADHSNPWDGTTVDNLGEILNRL